MYQRYCKRLLDFVLSLAACIVLAPVMLAIAVCIKMDSPGPVFSASAGWARTKPISTF